MAFTLQDLINAHTNPGSGEDGKAQSLTQFIEANDQNGEVNLDALIQEAATEFEAMSTGDSLANMDALRALTAVVSGLNDARGTRKAAQDEQMAEVADLAKVIQSATQTEDAVAEDTVDAVTEDTAETVDAAPDAEPTAETAEPAVDAAPVAVAAALDAPDEDDDEGEGGKPFGGKKAAPFGKKPVVAGGRPVNLAELRRDRKVQPREPEGPRRASIIASAEVRGVAAGADLSMEQLTDAVISKANSYRGFGQGVVAQNAVASIRPAFPAELVTNGGVEDDARAIEAAVDESRLKGGSLVASGGWASPSERMYELVPGLESATAGLVSVPEIMPKRGGIEFTRGIDFDQISGQAGLGEFQTEAQAEAGTTKLKYRIPKVSFVEVRADAFYTQIGAGILQEKTYPEISKRVIPGALAVHAHDLNARSISDMVALSKVVPLQTHGPSATTALLNGIAFQILDYRYRYRAEPNLRLEVMLPDWAREVIRADISLRETANGEPLQVSDAQIKAWFSARNANVQFVVDWQDQLAGGGTLGGHTNGVPTTTAYPTTVKVLIYAAGTFVRGRGDVISLDTIYDSRGLETNDYLRLFMEEMYFMAWRAHHSRVVTLPTSVNGATAQRIVLDGQGAPAPATP